MHRHVAENSVYTSPFSDLAHQTGALVCPSLLLPLRHLAWRWRSVWISYLLCNSTCSSFKRMTASLGNSFPLIDFASVSLPVFLHPYPLSFCIFFSSRCLMTQTLQSRALCPAWSPSRCGGSPAGQSSCLRWPSDRLSSTTVTANLNPTRLRSHRGPPLCRSAPPRSSPSPPLTPPGEAVGVCVWPCQFMHLESVWDSWFVCSCSMVIWDRKSVV